MIGCSPGFLNVPKIKGTHNAVRSGIIAADTAFDGIIDGSLNMESGNVGMFVKQHHLNFYLVLYPAQVKNWLSNTFF